MKIFSDLRLCNYNLITYTTNQGVNRFEISCQLRDLLESSGHCEDSCPFTQEKIAEMQPEDVVCIQFDDNTLEFYSKEDFQIWIASNIESPLSKREFDECVFQYFHTTRNDATIRRDAARNLRNAELAWALNESEDESDDEGIREAYRNLVENDWNRFENLPEDFRNDESIVMAAVRQNGLALQYASETARNRESIVMAAVRQNGLALQYASETARNREYIVMAAVRQNGLALQYASETARNREYIVMAAVRQNGLALQYASETARNCKNIAMAAVEQNGLALQYASETARNCKNIAMAAVEQNGHAFQHVLEDFKKDKDVVLAAFKQCEDAVVFDYLPENTKSDKEIMLAIFQQCSARQIESALKKKALPVLLEKDFLLALLDQAKEESLQKFVAEIIVELFQDDQAAVLQALQKNLQCYNQLSGTLLQNREFMFAVLQMTDGDDYRMIKSIVTNCNDDLEIALAAFEKNNSAFFAFSSTLLQNREFMLTVLQKTNRDSITITIIQKIVTNFNNDLEIARAAVEKKGTALEYISEYLKKNLEVVRAALEETIKAWKYVPEDLKNNESFAHYSKRYQEKQEKKAKKLKQSQESRRQKTMEKMQRKKQARFW